MGRPRKSSFIRVTDQFCGAGGFTTAAKMIPGIEVLLAMNHWKLAIDSHAANHREVDHFCADVSTLDPSYFDYTEILLTSPECITYSPASGINQKKLRQPSLFHPDEMNDAIVRSRATMRDVVRWADHHRHEAIIVENVPQIRTAYLQWEGWIKELRKLGYRIQFCHFNSRHFHPIPQSRDRVYIVLTRMKNPAPDLNYRPRAFCPNCERDIESEQTWKDATKLWGKYGLKNGQYYYACPQCRKPVEPYYYCAGNIIDWAIPIPRVGDRKKPLSPRTLERIRYGLEKFAQPCVVEAKTHVNARPLTEPVGTVVAGGNHHFLATPPAWILEQRGRQFPVRGLDETVGTLVGSTTHHYLACDPFLFSLSYGGRSSALTAPVPAQTTQTDKWLVVPPFMLDKKGPQAVRSLAEPMSTQAGKAQIYLCLPNRQPVDPEVFRREKLPPVEECGYRMFEPKEIKLAMGFPEDYIVLGSRDDQVGQLGNAVTPDVPKWILGRVIKSLEGSR